MKAVKQSQEEFPLLAKREIEKSHTQNQDGTDIRNPLLKQRSSICVRHPEAQAHTIHAETVVSELSQDYCVDFTEGLMMKNQKCEQAQACESFLTSPH